jgi:hypothetical protein
MADASGLSSENARVDIRDPPNLGRQTVGAD